jgi:hypothetical protein
MAGALKIFMLLAKLENYSFIVFSGLDDRTSQEQ